MTSTPSQCSVYTPKQSSTLITPPPLYLRQVITNSNHPPSKEENTKDETLDTTSYPGLPSATASLRQWMDYLRLMSTHSALTKNSLTAKLTSLLTHILSSTHVSHASGGGGGGPPPVVMSASVRAEIAQEVEEKIAKILESAHSTGSTHQINTPYDQQALLSTSPTNIP